VSTATLSFDILERIRLGPSRLAMGSYASTYESSVTPFAGTVLQVHGTKASLLFRGLLTGSEPTAEVLLRDDLGLRPFARGGPDHLYRLGARAFVDAVGTGRPVASGMDGLIALGVALATKEAVATHQAVPVVYPTQCNLVVMPEEGWKVQ
jgi:1,5-anhydro-D-fructose reductase (1,5-anhydro-D-mannitol-forming)